MCFWMHIWGSSIARANVGILVACNMSQVLDVLWVWQYGSKKTQCAGHRAWHVEARLKGHLGHVDVLHKAGRLLLGGQCDGPTWSIPKKMDPPIGTPHGTKSCLIPSLLVSSRVLSKLQSFFAPTPCLEANLALKALCLVDPYGPDGERWSIPTQNCRVACLCAAGE